MTAYIRQWLDRVRPARTYEAIAKELGVSHAHLIGIHQGVANAGAKVETAFAALHHGGSIDELRRVAIEAYATEEARHAKFPNREEAADICRRGGVDPRAIQSVLADPEPPSDHDTLKWIHLIQLRELDIRRDDASRTPGSERPSRRPIGKKPRM